MAQQGEQLFSHYGCGYCHVAEAPDAARRWRESTASRKS